MKGLENKLSSNADEGAREEGFRPSQHCSASSLIRNPSICKRALPKNTELGAARSAWERAWEKAEVCTLTCMSFGKWFTCQLLLYPLAISYAAPCNWSYVQHALICFVDCLSKFVHKFVHIDAKPSLGNESPKIGGRYQRDVFAPWGSTRSYPTSGTSTGPIFKG